MFSMKDFWMTEWILMFQGKFILKFSTFEKLLIDLVTDWFQHAPPPHFKWTQNLMSVSRILIKTKWHGFSYLSLFSKDW